MKILKYFLLLLLVVIAVGLIYVGFQPSDYNVSRSKIIKAPLSRTFDKVNDLKTWEDWGPWHDEDSTIVVTYGETTFGLGASNSWTSKDGPGNIKTVNVVPNELIEQKMQFDDNKPNNLIWKFEDVDEGTEVTWQMKGEDAPFMFKFFAAFSGGWDGMLGSMLEKGLNNLDKVLLSEKGFGSSKVTTKEIIITEIDAKKFIGYYHKGENDEGHEGMTNLFIQNMPKAGVYATRSGLKAGDYSPGYLYTKMSQKNEESEFYIGTLLNKALKPATGMKSVTIPKGKAVKISIIGGYGFGEIEAHTKLTKYIETNKLEATGFVLKLYVDNTNSGIAGDIQTDIYYLLK